jgi:transposase
VRVHRNAKTTPKGRGLLVQRVTELGWPMQAAAHASGVSLRTGYKSLARYRAEGTAGFADRSCAPHRRRAGRGPGWSSGSSACAQPG